MKSETADPGARLMKSQSKAPSKRRRLIFKWSLLVVVIGVTLAVDLVTKHLAEQRLVIGETDKILPFLYLERSANDGVAFGLLSGNTTLIAIANVVALLVVGTYVAVERRVLLASIAGGAVIGGSLGNMIQRLSGDGHVTDFLKFPHWPNFNMADVFIDAGIAFIFLGLVLEVVRTWRSGRRAPTAP